MNDWLTGCVKVFTQGQSMTKWTGSTPSFFQLHNRYELKLRLWKALENPMVIIYLFAHQLPQEPWV